MNPTKSKKAVGAMQRSRREFLAGVAVAAAAAAVTPAHRAFAASSRAQLKFGYAAMPWGKKERQAINDISTAGYQGIQFRADALTDFTPVELRDLLEQHKLTFVALSSGQVSLDPATEADQIATHTANARFVRDSGGLYLQILDQLESYQRKVTPAECKQLGRLLTEIGKRTADLGIPLGYHNHLNTISEHPGNLDLVMENSDPRYVKLELDTAHSLAGGGDPAAQIAKYHDRLLFLHLKDVVDIPMSTPGARYPFEFVELGRGRVNLPAVFAALNRVAFKGWAVIELDREPVHSRTPLQSALISKSYLEKTIGVKV